MSKIRVTINYDDELNSIKIGGEEMDESYFLSIQNKPILDWFEPSKNGRDGWEGLIKEIKKFLCEDSPELYFEFCGPIEDKKQFDQIVQAMGYSVMSQNDTFDNIKSVEDNNMKLAQRAENLKDYDRALKYYLRAADTENSPEAQFKVGEIYFKFLNDEITIDADKVNAARKSFKYFEPVAKQGNYEAQYYLFKLYVDKNSDFNNQEDALYWLKRSAQSGYAPAQCELGLCYANGNLGLKQNWNKAAQWYIKSAEQGYADAQNRLANRYENGQGVEQDDELAFKWRMNAAEQGHAIAQYNIGINYLKGEAVDEDIDQAVSWLEKSAKQENADAQYLLGILYYSGTDVEEDKERGKKLVSQSAEHGNAMAQNMLGDIFWEEEDYKKAVGWYKKSAKQGYEDAKTNLACAYYIGDGVDRDINIAIEYVRNLAEEGNPEAQYILAMCYFEIGKDDEAEKLMCEAQAQGHEGAYEWLHQGLCRALEIADELKDAVSGLKTIEEIEELAERSPMGKFLLGVKYLEGKEVEKDFKKAARLFKEAADHGISLAQYELGVLFEEGKGVAKNVDRAFEWYKKAADNEDDPSDDACFRIAEEYYKQADSLGKERNVLLVSASILIPFTSFVTVPAALLGTVAAKKLVMKKFLNTDAGKEMMHYYEKAADLGHQKAKNRYEKLIKMM